MMTNRLEEFTPPKVKEVCLLLITVMQWYMAQILRKRTLGAKLENQFFS